ncbi:cobaltochelatase subunit CobN [Pyrobaculum sp. 3827-6]|uniref:cobaltochelatase subunit CobN n=1 Tax=Pyrobaculum sp. 3827-6 TaxID=2983604 RepID=UPI0021D88209|nr:cobaltochelatase subunit CobN [Pyrobaculum sp. 3827-6]MCU7787540.1 cobaltochelatase subunit CobN [Pyrobaculum sp. 3827-6]
MKVLIIATSAEWAQNVALAVRRIRERLGPVLAVRYRRAESAPPDVLKRDVEWSDVVLVDVRGGLGPLEELLRGEKTVFGLVGSSMALTRVGGFKMPSEAFDRSDVPKPPPQFVTDIVKGLGSLVPVGVLKHMKNWALAVEYWTYGGVENLENLFLMLLREYGGHSVDYSPPVKIEDPYIYDPDVGPLYGLPPLDPGKPTVGVLIYSRGHRPSAERLVKRLKELSVIYGFNLLPVASWAADNLHAMEKFFTKGGVPVVDVVLWNQWFRINGGPYMLDPRKTIELLKRLNVPVLNAARLNYTDVDRWRQIEEGATPVELISTVALPEADGVAEPILTTAPRAGGYSEEIDGVAYYFDVVEDRLEKRLRRALRWAVLRRKPREQVKIAFVVYNYPPGEENLGRASHLDVFGTLEVLLKALRERGYAVEVKTAQELREAFLEGGLVNVPKWKLSGGVRVPVENYLQYFNTLPPLVREKVVGTWGPPPGDYMVEEGYLVVPALLLGNAAVILQPARGFHERPDLVYHSRDVPPHHQYLATYWWIREVFEADVVVHVGTHGTLEFTPGKEVLLSSECFPDVLIGDVPHIYIYNVNNPSEATIAKRRSYAVMVNHMTPPFTTSGLYEEFTQLASLIDEYEEAEKLDPDRARLLEREILERARQLHIDGGSVEEIHAALYRYNRTIIPKGLHLFGRPWSREDALEFITLLLRYDRDFPSPYRELARRRGWDYDAVLRREPEKLKILDEEIRVAVEECLEGGRCRLGAKVAEFIANTYQSLVKNMEVEAFLNAVAGGYVEPGLAGDPIRTPDVLPTGRNSYAFDPRLIPSDVAYRRGAEIAEQILKAYRERYGRYPEAVGVVLWGLETIRTRGETVGQILSYLGVRLKRRHGGWQYELEVIPLKELGRPRVDVVVTISGMFRDIFPHLIELLDDAFQKVASLDEPEDMNFIKKRRHIRYRIFGPKPGEYAPHLPQLIESSAWREEADLAKAYLFHMSFAYGRGAHGVEDRDSFEKLLKDVEVVSQVRDSHLHDIVDLDHYYEFLGGLAKSVEVVRGAKPEILVADTTYEYITVEDVSASIKRGLITRLLNPTWIEEMLKAGYHGAQHIAERVDNLMGLSATTGKVEDWMWRQVFQRYIAEERFRKWLKEVNPYALHAIATRIYEAYKRGYWRPTEEELATLEEVITSLEKEIE